MPLPARLTLVPFALAAALGLAACQPAAAPAGASNATLVSVSAHAEVRKAPDVAVVSTGITSLAADANAAIRRNSEQMQQLMAALKAAGVKTLHEGGALNLDAYRQGLAEVVK